MWFVQLPILKASGDSDQRMTKIEHYIFGEKAHLSSTSSHPPPIPPSSPPIQSPFPNYILSQHLLDDSQILQLAENHRTGIPPKSVAQLLLNCGKENEDNAIFTLKQTRYMECYILLCHGYVHVLPDL
uniref:Uncharacterized protein n=1 Tax=Rhizophagus irregularis (strain DAOM 181602 / DAOM 197198 / MUCL 43194) TaxID=747089 RepID=U9T006_RHIID